MKAVSSSSADVMDLLYAIEIEIWTQLMEGTWSVLAPRRRKYLRQLHPQDIPAKDQGDIIQGDDLEELNDFIINLLDDNSVRATLLFEPDFAAMLKPRVQSLAPTMEMSLAPSTGNEERTTIRRYQHTTLNQSKIVMPPPSLSGLGPINPCQLDARISDPFPKLKQARQPPMLKY